MASGLIAWFGSLFGSRAALAENPEAQPQAEPVDNPEIIDLDDPRYTRYSDARRAFWSKIGPVDDDVIAYLISPEFTGAPAWPTTRQSYLIVRPNKTLIIASDGLSDLFANTNMQEAGFECEVYIETDQLLDAKFEDIRASWQFDLIQTFAQNVANMGGINRAIEDYGILSMELPSPETMPAKWQTERGTVGALLNLAPAGRAAKCTLEADVAILIISLLLITPDETEFVLAGGSAARQELADRLLASGAGVISSLDRTSVLA